jgi:hypothetical protein
MDLAFREGYWIEFCMKLIAVIYHDNFYSHFHRPSVNWYNNGLLPLIRQFFLIPNRIDEFMVLRHQCFTSYLNHFCQNLITAWQFILFNFAMAVSTSEGLGSDTNSSAVCISVCLTSLTLCTVNKMWESASRLPCCVQRIDYAYYHNTYSIY